VEKENEEQIANAAHELTNGIKDVMESLNLIAHSPINCPICTLNKELAKVTLEVFRRKLIEFGMSAGQIRKPH
jgi:hypothetical protein